MLLIVNDGRPAAVGSQQRFGLHFLPLLLFQVMLLSLVVRLAAAMMKNLLLTMFQTLLMIMWQLLLLLMMMM